MRDYITLGSAPADEDCAQVGQPDYETNARKECLRYVTQLRKLFGVEPDGAKLSIKRFPHDFGCYYEVVCYFTDTDQSSVDYAFNIEANLPATWQKDTLPN